MPLPSLALIGKELESCPSLPYMKMLGGGQSTIFGPIHQRTEVAKEAINLKSRDRDEFREIYYPRLFTWGRRSSTLYLGRTTYLTSNFDKLLETEYRQLWERENLEGCSHRNSPHFHELSVQEVQSGLMVRNWGNYPGPGKGRGRTAIVKPPRSFYLTKAFF